MESFRDQMGTSNCICMLIYLRCSARKITSIVQGSFKSEDRRNLTYLMHSATKSSSAQLRRAFGFASVPWSRLHNEAACAGLEIVGTGSIARAGCRS
jgi:hypothetical protein